MIRNSLKWDENELPDLIEEFLDYLHEADDIDQPMENEELYAQYFYNPEDEATHVHLGHYLEDWESTLGKGYKQEFLLSEVQSNGTKEIYMLYSPKPTEELPQEDGYERKIISVDEGYFQQVIHGVISEDDLFGWVDSKNVSENIV